MNCVTLNPATLKRLKSTVSIWRCINQSGVASTLTRYLLRIANHLKNKLVQPTFNVLSEYPNNSLKSPQLNLNAAVRVLTGTRKREPISPILVSLHWLPVKSSISLLWAKLPRDSLFTFRIRLKIFLCNQA